MKKRHPYSMRLTVTNRLPISFTIVAWDSKGNERKAARTVSAEGQTLEQSFFLMNRSEAGSGS
jgi:hypothetical protein